MSKGKFILVNGLFVPTEEFRISLPEVESYQFSEKFRAIRSALPFFRETLELFKLKLLIFNQAFPEFTDHEGAGLKRQLERTLTKNKHFLGAFLTLTFRFTDQKVNFCIQSEKLDDIGFELNEKGLFVNIFDKIQKPASSLSNLSLGSDIYWNIARSHPGEVESDLPILLNTKEQIVEVPESNIYILSGKTVRGASSEQGAYRDITKPVMLDIFRKLNLEYIEDEGISIQNLEESEELFVVNSIEGIRWIVGCGGKRYFNNTVRKINEMFKQRILN